MYYTMNIDEIIISLTSNDRKLLVAFSHENLPNKRLIRSEDEGYFRASVYFPWFRYDEDEMTTFREAIDKLHNLHLIDMTKIPYQGNTPIPKITTEDGDYIIELLNDETQI